jgi:predicted HTH domain antitoxin
MHTTTVVIPDELVLELASYRGNLDDLLRIGLREVKKEQSLALFKQGHISLWKAARMAGISLREMTEYAAAQGLRAILDDEMIEEELA